MDMARHFEQFGGFAPGDRVLLKPWDEVESILGKRQSSYMEFLKSLQDVVFTIKDIYDFNDGDVCCHSYEDIEIRDDRWRDSPEKTRWLIRISTIQHFIEGADLCNSKASIGSLFHRGGEI